MFGELYYYQKNENVRLSDSIKEAVKHFIKKHGYTPEYVVVREDESDGLAVDIPVRKVSKTLQPSHYMLGLSVKRFPRILKEGRICYG